MNAEMKKRNFWQRLKMAFLLLFSNKPLNPVWQEGFTDGKATVYDDYRVIKEEMLPFVKKLTDINWHGDKGIVVPGMITNHLFEVPVFLGMDCLGDCLQVSDRMAPEDTVSVEILRFRQEQIEWTMREDARFARRLSTYYSEASKQLAAFLLGHGYIKAQQIASEPGFNRIVFYVNSVKRC